jgi:homeobox-leucine zipper protein
VCEGKESSTMQLEMQENGMRSLVMGASSIGGMTTSSTWTSLGLSAVEEEEEEEEIARLGAAGVVVVDVNVPCYSRRSSSRRQSPPVQLDLLPGCCTMRSSAHSSETSTPAPSSVTNPCFSWQMLASRTNSGSAAGGYVDDGEVETYSSAAAPEHHGVSRKSYRDIDINQLPSATTDGGDELGAVVSTSPESSIGMIKRERSGVHDVFDHLQEKSDRGGGFELSSRAGTAAAGAGVSDDDEDGGTNTRKKLRLTKEQSALLEESFKDHSTLNPKQKTALAKQLHLRPRQVEVWLQNIRARTKLKQTEVDCEVLKRCCENLTQENHRLRKELQELRALKLVAAPPPPPYHVQLAAHARHDFYNNMPLPAATLTMCPSCKRLGKL